jgi:uncharacterized membrane protein
MKLLRWLLLTFILAIVFHIALMWYLPTIFARLVISDIASDLTKSEGMPFRWNSLFHRPLVEATGSVGFPNPDVIYSFAAYDVSQGMVRIHCVIPEGIPYWSVSLNDLNSNNFFVENDRTAQSSEFDLFLKARDVDRDPHTKGKVVKSSTKRGIIFIRAVISDRNNQDELERIVKAQKASFVEPVL